MRSGLFIFTMGLACGAISGLSVGCTNHGGFAQVSQNTGPSTASKGQKNAHAASEEPSASATISGTWNCVDESCDNAIVAISSDLSAMTRYETIRDSSGAQSCRIEEPFQVHVSDSSDPDRVEATVSGGAPILVATAQNTADCDALIKDIAQQPTQNQAMTFERDEGGILVIDGQRFLNAQEN